VLGSGCAGWGISAGDSNIQPAHEADEVVERFIKYKPVFTLRAGCV